MCWYLCLRRRREASSAPPPHDQLGSFDPEYTSHIDRIQSIGWLVDSQAEVLRRPQHSVRARSPPRRNRGATFAPEPRGERMQEDFGWVGSFATRSESQRAVHEMPESPVEIPGNRSSDIQTPIPLQAPASAIVRNNPAGGFVDVIQAGKATV